jgi:DNA-binding LacI/PurR family transcriptional regulator
MPSAAARALAGTRTGLVGVVIFEEPDGLFADPVLLELLHGINTELSLHDYMITLGTVPPSADPIKTYRRLLESYRVDGCIVETTRREEGLQLFTERAAPCVVLGYTRQPLPQVHPADRRGAEMVVNYLLDLDHRTIGVITGPPRTLAVEARLRGYQDALRNRGLSPDANLILPGTFRFEAGYAGAAQLMAQEPQPTAIFAQNDRMALGAIRWLTEHGYRVPADVSVAGFDDIAQADQGTPPLTTVRQTPMDIGRRAAWLLLEQIEEKPLDTFDIEIPVTLVPRESTGPPSGQGSLRSRLDSRELPGR